MKRVCVIPARGGSKRIPRKNVRNFLGKPMIGWSIEAALKSECFDRIVVSTDDDEIANVAESYGASVPFRRPPALADDHAPTIPVVADAIKRLSLSSQTIVCCLYATAPMVTAADLRAGLDYLERTEARFVMSVTSYAYPIQRALRRLASGEVEMFDTAQERTRSQDLEKAWHDAGQFYWGRALFWISGESGFGSGVHGLPLPRHQVQDIDTEEDWQHAELMVRAMQAGDPG